MSSQPQLDAIAISSTTSSTHQNSNEISMAQVNIKVEEVIDVTGENGGIKQEMDEVNHSSFANSAHVTGSAHPTPLKSAMKQNTTSVNKDNLMKLEKEQMTYTKYPVGCRVYYNFNSQTTPLIYQPTPKLVNSFSVGRVVNVYMDLDAKNFVYQIVPFKKNATFSGSEMLTEAQIAYASGTPVMVQFAENEAVHEGEINGCHIDSYQMKMYSVTLFSDKNNIQVYDQVNSEMIKYRSPEKKSAAQGQLASADPVASDAKQTSTPANKNDNTKVKQKLSPTHHQKTLAAMKLNAGKRALSNTSGASRRRRSQKKAKKMNAN